MLKRAWLRPCPIGSAGVDGECHPCDFPLMQDGMLNGHHQRLMACCHPYISPWFLSKMSAHRTLWPNFDPSLVLIVVCWCFMPGWEQNQLHWTIDIATLPLCSFELYRSFVQAVESWRLKGGGDCEHLLLWFGLSLPKFHLFKQCKVLHQIAR